jgi:signal transduction histidine kinase
MQPLQPVAVDLVRLLQEAMEQMRELPGAAQRHISVLLPKIPGALSAVPGDPELLLLAIVNLLSNAVKFTRPGDTIEVRAIEEGSYARVEVADSGPGIPPDELPHMGKELYRGRDARGKPGSGLGLALTRASVERHGGKLTVRSRPGKGAVFAVRLPLQSS